jgi:hypothetical protein
MSSETLIRPARDDELLGVLRLWQEADVTPPSVTDSIEGLIRLTNAPGGILLVATTGDQITAGSGRVQCLFAFMVTWLRRA